ncbi:MAG: hypothetical protein AAFP69_23415, partial [Planctomycetota bacterium]
MTLLLVYLFIAIGFSFYCSVAEAVLLSVAPSFIASMRERRPAVAARLEALKRNIYLTMSEILSINNIDHTLVSDLFCCD